MRRFDSTAGSVPAQVYISITRNRATRLAMGALVVILGVAFGLQYASARLMGVAGVEPVGALLLIHIGLALLFLSGLILTGKLFWPSAAQIVFFLVVSLLSNIGQLGIELIAGHHVPAGEMTLIVSLLPVFVLLMTAMMGSEALTARKVCGILLGVAASTVILLPRALEGEAEMFWVILTFAAPVSQALGMVLMVRFWPKGLEPLQVAAGNLTMGTLLMLPVVLLSGGSLGVAGLWGEGGVATGLFGLTVAAEFYILALLSRKGGAVLASCADFIAVVAGLGFGYMLFAEVPTVWMLLAAGFCLLALRLASDRAPSEFPA